MVINSHMTTIQFSISLNTPNDMFPLSDYENTNTAEFSKAEF